MRQGIVIGLVLAMMAVASCGDSDSSDSSFSCDDVKSKCPNDEPFDPNVCRIVVGHPTCGNVFVAFLRCVGDHQTCTADGKTDETVTDRECASEKAAAEQCGNTVDGGRL